MRSPTPNSLDSTKDSTNSQPASSTLAKPPSYAEALTNLGLLSKRRYQHNPYSNQSTTIYFTPAQK